MIRTHPRRAAAATAGPTPGGRASLGLAGQVGGAAELMQQRRNVPVGCIRRQCVLQVPDNLASQLSCFRGRQAAQRDVELSQVVPDEPVFERGAAHGFPLSHGLMTLPTVAAN
jgi:hypothetical protein